MTVSSSTAKVTANGNGVATSFSFSPIVINESGDLQVTLVDADGNETLLSEGTSSTTYAVVVSSYPGTGSITYPASGGSPIALGVSIVMKRVLDLTQSIDFENQGGYYPDVLEAGLDRAMMINIQQQDDIERSVKVPVSESGTTLELPPAAERANSFLAFDSDGNCIASTGGIDPSVPVSAFSETLLGLSSAGAWASALGVVSPTAYMLTLLDDVDAATARTTLGIGASSTTASGIVELATDAETQTGTDTARAITPANLTAKEASVAQVRANTADRILTTDIMWSSLAEVTLTDAATITVDMNTFINAVVTLGGNRALGNPSNEKVGQSGHIRIVQDATGSRTLSYGTDWEFTNASAPVLTTTANAEDMLFYKVIANNRVFGSLNKAIG